MCFFFFFWEDQLGYVFTRALMKLDAQEASNDVMTNHCDEPIWHYASRTCFFSFDAFR